MKCPDEYQDDYSDYKKKITVITDGINSELAEELNLCEDT